MKAKEFATFTSALLILASAAEAKDISAIKAILTETKAGVSSIKTDKDPNHIKLINNSLGMQKAAKEAVDSQNQFNNFLGELDNLDGNVSEEEFNDFIDENLKKVCNYSGELNRSVRLFLHDSEIRRALKKLDVINSDYPAIIAFMNGDYSNYANDEMSQRIRKLFCEDIESLKEFDSFFSEMGPVGGILFRDSESNFNFSLSLFFDYLSRNHLKSEEDKLAPKTIKGHIDDLYKTRKEKRKRKEDFKNKNIKDADLTALIDLLSLDNVSVEDLGGFLDYFGYKNEIIDGKILLIGRGHVKFIDNKRSHIEYLNKTIVDDAILKMMNDPDFRESLLTLINAENVNAFLKACSQDFSDQNLPDLLTDVNFKALLDSIKTLCAQDPEIRTYLVDIFCDFYKIEPENKALVDGSIDEFLDVDFFKKALAFCLGESSSVALSYPKLSTIALRVIPIQ